MFDCIRLSKISEAAREAVAEIRAIPDFVNTTSALLLSRIDRLQRDSVVANSHIVELTKKLDDATSRLNKWKLWAADRFAVEADDDGELRAAIETEEDKLLNERTAELNREKEARRERLQRNERAVPGVRVVETSSNGVIRVCNGDCVAWDSTWRYLSPEDMP